MGLEQGPQYPLAHAYTHEYRIRLLSLCVQATKAFFENRFASPVGEFPRYICVSSFDFLLAFLAALKLITLRAPGWDLVRAREDLEFDEFLERQVRDTEYVAGRRKRSSRRFVIDGVLVEEAEEDPFLKLAKKLRALGKIIVSARLSQPFFLSRFPLGAC
jgi:hypothetical protein